MDWEEVGTCGALTAHKCCKTAEWELVNDARCAGKDDDPPDRPDKMSAISWATAGFFLYVMALSRGHEVPGTSSLDQHLLFVFGEIVKRPS